MADLLEETITEKYWKYFSSNPLKFMKETIDWSAFPPLIDALYHNDTDKGGAPNIPITTMVKVLFLQSIYNLSDEQIEREIHNRISFMNFLNYTDRLPGSTTVWIFRERLSKTGRDRVIWNELQGQLDSKGIRIKRGTMQDATFIASDPGHEKLKETRELGKTRRSKDGTFTTQR